MGKLKLKVGNVFSIPINDNEVGFGQLINFPRTKDVFIMIVFDYKEKIKDNYNLEKICSSKILFLGYSLDAKLQHKDWNIIGEFTNNISNIILPYHKLGLPPDDTHITNYKGEIIRIATGNEFSQLSYKTTIAPIRYENALKAHFKLQEWKNEDYDKLLYEYTLKSNEIALSQV